MTIRLTEVLKMIEGYNIAGQSKTRTRVENDYYATPETATRELLNNFSFLNCETILEPACGEGHICKTIQEWDSENKFKITATDLIERGFGEGNVDFLTEKFDNYDLVITNPPFKYAKEFVEKGLEVANKYVVMFAKLQLLEGIGRKDLFENHPPKYVYVFRNRVAPLRNGSSVDENGKKWSSTMCFAWFVWEVGFKGEPTIRWLQTNSKKGRIF